MSDKQTEFITELLALLRKYDVNLDAADDYDSEDVCVGTTYSFYADGIDIDMPTLKKMIRDNILEQGGYEEYSPLMCVVCGQSATNAILTFTNPTDKVIDLQAAGVTYEYFCDEHKPITEAGTK